MHTQIDRKTRGRPDNLEIRRPTENDWAGILRVLQTANFHAIGCSEMPSFPLSDCFVASVGNVIIGVGGYRILDDLRAKTTLLAVDPAWRGYGIGEMLQEARLDVMRESGATAIYTNTDDDLVIDWLTRKYGFRLTGETIPKTCDFGRSERDHWITLVLDTTKENRG